MPPCRCCGSAFIGAIGYLATQPLPLHAQIAMVLSAGLIGGFGINLGHELGHKNTKLERWLAKIVLAPTGYGHFFIEHNHGHHRDVATPAGPGQFAHGRDDLRLRAARDARRLQARLGHRARAAAQARACRSGRCTTRSCSRR